MIETTSVPVTGTAPQPSRRRFLSQAGGLAALAALAGTGLLSSRAADQGVLAPATGPAYDAWRQFHARGGQPLDLVRAAVLAANAHNTQPWRFRLYPGRIDLYTVPERTTGTMDPLRREMYISLGCALENLALAAQAAGLAPSVRVTPDPTDPTLAASVQLGSAAPVDSPLYRAIPDRHTNRGPYRTGRPVPGGVLDEMAALATESDTGVVWWTAAQDKRTFADVTVRATEAIVADPAQAADDYRWWRGTRAEIQHFQDGITLDASGLPPLIRAAGKLMPNQTRAEYGASWITSTRDTHVATAAAFGAVVVHDPADHAQRVRAGRVWQRLHLWATARGLAVQPLNQMLERADRERATGQQPVFGTAVAALMPERGWAPVMPFRIGYPTIHPLPSPRRPAGDVITQS
jgi:nitroreductase